MTHTVHVHACTHTRTCAYTHGTYACAHAHTQVHTQCSNAEISFVQSATCEE